MMFQKPTSSGWRKLLISGSGKTVSGVFQNQMFPEPAASAQRHMSSGPDCPEESHEHRS
jgi:hypothetical protein